MLHIIAPFRIILSYFFDNCFAIELSKNNNENQEFYFVLIIDFTHNI